MSPALRRNALTAAAGMAASALLLALGGCRAASGEAEGNTFRVMTFNIHHGRGLDERVELQRIADVITSERADIVGLQEVDRGVARTDSRDLPGELAALTGMTAIFEMNHPVQGGEYGNAILTRFPHGETRNTHLPRVGTTEQRGVQQAVIDIQGRGVLFMNTHIAHRAEGEPERLASVAEFERILRENEEAGDLPVIFVGDFNTQPGTEPYRKLAERLADVWPMAGEGPGATIPVIDPQRRIDYIWISRDAPFEPVRAWVPYTEASDHLPVVVEFSFRRGR
jgi:endonuclease/exonuclease/phosphatase family metal-dependent hydrolase